MGLFDMLFGSTKRKPARRDALFDMLTAYVTLESRHGTRAAGRAGVCLRPVASSFFQTLDQDVRDVLKVSAKDTKTTVEVKDDSHGYLWVVLADEDFEDLVATIHTVADMVVDHGFSDRLTAAVFKFQVEGREIYWIYNYSRGAYYPFVPEPGRETRDNQEELRLAAIMEGDLRIEKEVAQWYPLWDMPV